jgi:hypothetical protein
MVAVDDRIDGGWNQKEPGSIETIRKATTSYLVLSECSTNSKSNPFPIREKCGPSTARPALTGSVLPT